MLLKIWNWLKSYWVTPVKKQQRQWRKDHCLNKYNASNWKDDIYW